MSSEDRRPDWDYWKNVPNWTILQGVALSLNIDPNKLHHRVLPRTMGLGKTRVESPEFSKRLSLAIENIENLAVYKTVEEEFEKWKITRASFSALGRSLKWKVPPQMKARAEPDKREVEILNLKQQVEALTQARDECKGKATDVATITLNASRGELAKAQHAAKRERTLGAVLATVAIADRNDYIVKKSQKFNVAKLAGLVEDNRMKYEKHGLILSVDEIKKLVGKILSGKYFLTK